MFKKVQEVDGCYPWEGLKQQETGDDIHDLRGYIY